MSYYNVGGFMYSMLLNTCNPYNEALFYHLTCTVSENDSSY